MEGRGAGKIGGAAGPDSRGWAGLKLVGASASRWGGARAGRGGGGRLRREDGVVCAEERGPRSGGAAQAVSSGPQSPPRGEGGAQTAVLSLHGHSSPQPLCLPRLTSAKVAVAAASQREGFARTRSLGTSVAGLAGLSAAGT